MSEKKKTNYKDFTLKLEISLSRFTFTAAFLDWRKLVLWE